MTYTCEQLGPATFACRLDDHAPFLTLQWRDEAGRWELLDVDRRPIIGETRRILLAYIREAFAPTLPPRVAAGVVAALEAA
jgi:hypothetical protein